MKQLGLPPEDVPFVFDQMRTERRQFAARYRAEGERQAAAIRPQTRPRRGQRAGRGTQTAAEIARTLFLTSWVAGAPSTAGWGR
jgi:regulator of protease activity HflC (stomatin/prohibitin superfamily)